MISKYIIQAAEKSFCPICHSTTTLLCRKDGNNKHPWFYICFVCKTVLQVGKGECLWE